MTHTAIEAAHEMFARSPFEITSIEGYLQALQAVYRVANLSDSDHPKRPAWLDVNASSHQCIPIDQMLNKLLAKGSITSAQHRAFYDSL